MIKWHFRDEIRELDDNARSQTSGNFMRTPSGVTHYQQYGKGGSPLTVLIHGFSVPYFIWNPTFDALRHAGLRVMRYDLFGRGFSDRPDKRYDSDLFVTQLTELLDALGESAPVNIVGLSMGGAIAVGFTDRYPERVAKLVLMDPAGTPFKMPATYRLLRTPFIGEWLMDRYAERYIISGLADDFFMRMDITDFVAQYRVQMKYAGFRRALLSTLRHGPLGSMWEAYQRVGQHARPALLIWGEKDRTVPFERHTQVLEAMPNIRFVSVPDSGHVPHLERPDVVNPLLIDFLKD